MASYPFTTLHPIIGTIEYDDYSQIRVADIPGLIDGAHEGVGLGLEFLRHIERTRFLVFVLDMAASDGRNPVEDYRNLRQELAHYDASLNHRPFLVVANKMDVADAGPMLDAFRKETDQVPVAVSAQRGDGVDEIREALYRHFHGNPGTPE